MKKTQAHTTGRVRVLRPGDLVRVTDEWDNDLLARVPCNKVGIVISIDTDEEFQNCWPEDNWDMVTLLIDGVLLDDWCVDDIDPI